MPNNDEKITELACVLIDVFEDFLTERGVKELPSTKRLMREEGYSEEEIAENSAIIFGEDFEDLYSTLKDTFQNFGVSISYDE